LTASAAAATGARDQASHRGGTSHFRFPSALQCAGTGTGKPPRPETTISHSSCSSRPNSLVRPRRSHSLVPAARMRAPARAAARQGWRISATARLVLDARQHDGMLTRHWARHIATAARQLPRWHQHQTPSACSGPATLLVEGRSRRACGPRICWPKPSAEDPPYPFRSCAYPRGRVKVKVGLLGHANASTIFYVSPMVLIQCATPLLSRPPSIGLATDQAEHREILEADLLV